MDFSSLIYEAGLNDMIPREYSQLAPAVSDGLAMFLSGLPEDVQTSIVLDQACLAPDCPVFERLGNLARSSPVLHKLGQILARNQNLPPDLRRELQKLEWLPPTIPAAVIKTELERELGPLLLRRITLAPAPIAQASVAVVIPFARNDSQSKEKTPQFNAVFKMLKPGIEEKLRDEIELLDEVGSALDKLDSLGTNHSFTFRKLFTQITEALEQEILLEQEQQHLLQAFTDYACFTGIRIPRLLPDYCSPRVTAMERIYGHKLDAATIPQQVALKTQAELVVKAVIGHPLFSSSPRTLFHADPHAGNIFVTETGQLALLDWSQADFLRNTQQRAICNIMLSAMTLQQERLFIQLSDLAENQDFNPNRLRKVISEALGAVGTGTVAGFSWLTDFLDQAALQSGIRFPANILLFRKALLTITGIVEELSGSSRFVDSTLLQEFCQVFTEEWPERWMLPRMFKGRSTHLSTTDLFDAVFTAMSKPFDDTLKYWFNTLNTFR